MKARATAERRKNPKNRRQFGPAPDSKMRLIRARHGRLRKFSIYLLIAASIFGALSVSAVILVRVYWPFSEPAVRRSLEDATSATVSFERFHERHFPPGCVAEGVVFQKPGAVVPVLTIERLRISTNLVGLFHHHITLIHADGVHVNWAGWQDSQDEPSDATIIGRLVADDAGLEVPRQSSPGALRFRFHEFELPNLEGLDQTSFRAVFENPIPRGLIRTSGQFGPWNSPHPSQTAVIRGTYSHPDFGLD